MDNQFYKRNNYYYIFAPAGGVPTGWQTVLRSKNVFGPYEKRKVLDQGNTPINGPHQGAWVETQTGESWFFHFQDMDSYGRVVHLQPMVWENDWPKIGNDFDGNGVGEPVSEFKKPKIGKTFPIQTPIETDNFDEFSIGKQWQWQANPDVVWYAKLPGNKFLRLFSIKKTSEIKNLWNTPNLLLQKFPAPNFSATTKIKLVLEEVTEGKKAGIIVMGTDYAILAINHDEKGFFVEQNVAIDAINGGEEFVNELQRIRSDTVYFKVEVSSPDSTCQFLYSENGKNFLKIGKPFKAKPGKWIGSKIGLFSVSSQKAKLGSYADISFFEIGKK